MTSLFSLVGPYPTGIARLVLDEMFAAVIRSIRVTAAVCFGLLVLACQSNTKPLGPDSSLSAGSLSPSLDKRRASGISGGMLRVVKDQAAFEAHELPEEVGDFSIKLGMAIDDRGRLPLDLGVERLRKKDLDVMVLAGAPPFVPLGVLATHPVEYPPVWLVAHSGVASAPRSLPKLTGLEVHVLAGSQAHRTLQRLQREEVPKLKLMENNDLSTLIQGLREGRYPLVALNLRQLGRVDSSVTRLFSIASGTSSTWLIDAARPDLLSLANAFIVQRNMTGHVRELWTGDLAGIQQRNVLRVLTQSHPATYFIYKGQQMGFDFEYVRLLARSLKVRLSMVAVPRADLLIPWLLEGRGDLVASMLTITPQRAEHIDFSPPYFFTQELLVQKDGASDKISGVEDLQGSQIHVRRSSSYYHTLRALRKEFGPFTIIDAPEEMTTKSLIRQVAQGKIPATVADSSIAKIEQLYHGHIKTFPLPLPHLFSETKGAVDAPSLVDQRGIGFGFRPQSPKLKAHLEKFVQKTYRGTPYNMLKKKYFQKERKQSLVPMLETGVRASISPYDALIKKYARKYNLDWRLLSAQAYQESRFEPRAHSWAGAVGLFQIMPRTGEELGFTRLEDPEVSVHAGTRYLSRMLNRFDKKIDFRQRLRFALASFNAGYGHVSDARKLAKRRGLDPNRWFQNVEKAMLLLEKRHYYQDARYGYCRGSEPVNYVSNIQRLYEAYTRLYPAH
jgi:membrane-bound lytic murein transglycosylase F